MGENANLLRELINCAEKAANIARVCRSNEALLSLLVQEKSGAEANARFEHDFKTLADVLIQETIKHDIGQVFPAMQEAILGEESPTFTNKLGQTITIAVGDTEAATAACLEAVLDGHKGAAEALAAEVHRKVNYKAPNFGDIPDLPEQLDYGNLGIWIDPIGTVDALPTCLFMFCYKKLPFRCYSRIYCWGFCFYRLSWYLLDWP